MYIWMDGYGYGYLGIYPDNTRKELLNTVNYLF